MDVLVCYIGFSIHTRLSGVNKTAEVLSKYIWKSRSTKERTAVLYLSLIKCNIQTYTNIYIMTKTKKNTHSLLKIFAHCCPRYGFKMALEVGLQQAAVTIGIPFSQYPEGLLHWSHRKQGKPGLPCVWYIKRTFGKESKQSKIDYICPIVAYGYTMVSIGIRFWLYPIGYWRRTPRREVNGSLLVKCIETTSLKVAFLHMGAQWLRHRSLFGQYPGRYHERSVIMLCERPLIGRLSWSLHMVSIRHSYQNSFKENS